MIAEANRLTVIYGLQAGLAHSHIVILTLFLILGCNSNRVNVAGPPVLEVVSDDINVGMQLVISSTVLRLQWGFLKN